MSVELSVGDGHVYLNNLDVKFSIYLYTSSTRDVQYLTSESAGEICVQLWLKERLVSGPVNLGLQSWHLT